VRGEKTLARLANGFAFLLAKPEFYSHLASWRVVIGTPHGSLDLKQEIQIQIQIGTPV
jgi:hypothetical protein